MVAVASLLAVALNHGRMGFMVEYCMLIQDLLQEVTVGGNWCGLFGYRSM